MKRFTLFPILAVAVALGAGSCADDAMNLSPKDGYGHIRLRGSADVQVETRATRAELDLSTIGVTAPAPGDFALKLTCPDPEFSKQWPTIDAFNIEDDLYKAGVYTAVVSYGSPDEEGTDKPYYYGTQEVTVIATQTATAQINASIANSLAEIRTTAAFDQYFHDAAFTLRTASGNEFAFTPKSGVTAVPVFVKAATKLTVTGTARRQSQTGEDEGPEVAFAEQALEQTVARTRHIFTFDAADAGSATLHITLDENEEITVSVDVELNENAE